jgi:DNA adenine methylase
VIGLNSFVRKNSTKPFLRWAGGKSWLTKHLNKIIGDIEFQNYHEPFLGGGAIFFALESSKNSYLSDLNAELVDTYLALKTDPLKVIRAMKMYENTEDFYYDTRNSSYTDPSEKAARFIYLNQTSFNGLYRVNQEGRYNVPYGYRSKPFLEENKLIQASQYLQKASITCGDFTSGKKKIRVGDLVFLDPPYTVSHNNNGFIKYNQKLFSIEDQKRLSKFIDYIKARGAYYILTNAAHPEIGKIFDKGDNQIELSRASLIGGEYAKRGQTTEYIFTNITGGLQ